MCVCEPRKIFYTITLLQETESSATIHAQIAQHVGRAARPQHICLGLLAMMRLENIQINFGKNTRSEIDFHEKAGICWYAQFGNAFT